MATLPLHLSVCVSAAAGEHWRPTKLSIVLLGGRNSGKASLGNLILGKEEFVTRESTSCSRRVALVGRCFLTVVDTPGWWCDCSAQDTPELVKREIRTSVSLCSPGPHLFLVAVKSSSAFTEKRRRALEEHVALLGERVWAHCMVVFTSPPEQSGGAEGGALRWLAERCGQRCHTVASGEGSLRCGQELREKIQALVEGNGWSEFEMDEEVLLKATEEKNAVEERARQRLQRMRSHRALVRGESSITIQLSSHLSLQTPHHHTALKNLPPAGQVLAASEEVSLAPCDITEAHSKRGDC